MLGPNELAGLRRTLLEVSVRDELLGYIVDLVRMTRQDDRVMVGAGPRATQALVASSRVAAILEGRDFVTPDDVKGMAAPVLGHRLILRPEYEIEGLGIGEVVDHILQAVAVPR